MISLETVTLPDDMEWLDELDWNARKSTLTRLEDGRALYVHEARTGGRPMTLGGTYDVWLTRSVVQELRALEAQGGVFTLQFRGTAWTVAFDSSGETALEVRRLRASGPNPDNSVKYAVTLKLVLL